VIVTGAASGIGVETARALVAIDADVTLAVRDTEAGATPGGRDCRRHGSPRAACGDASN